MEMVTEGREMAAPEVERRDVPLYHNGGRGVFFVGALLSDMASFTDLPVDPDRPDNALNHNSILILLLVLKRSGIKMNSRSNYHIHSLRFI